MVNNFLTGLLYAIVNIVLKLLGWIAGIILYPIQVIVVSLFPGLGQALAGVLTYCNNDLFPTIAFIREVFLGVTQLPSSLYLLFIGIFISKFALIPSIVAIKQIVNVWRLKSGNINIKK